METRKMNCKESTSKTTIRLAIWAGSWTLTLALVMFGSKFMWESKTVTVIAIVANFLIGIGMIWANIKHLNAVDELQRKIQVEAIAFSLGIAVIAGLSYSALDITNVIGVDAEIGHLVMLIGITQMIALAVGKLRYK